MKTDQKITRRPAAKKAAKKKRFVKRGYMGSGETVPLAIAAKEALTYQIHLGNEDEGTDFKTWRHAQVKQVVGREGLTDCLHDHFKPLLGHFFTLAGKDEQALEAFLKTGKRTGKSAPDDTHEKCRIYAHEIRVLVTDHIHLAETPWPQLLDEFSAAGKDPKWVTKAMDRKIHIEQEGGPIKVGYVVTTARAKTGRPDLDLGADVWAGLATRCSIKQLKDLLSTMTNRVNAKEGVGQTGKRNRKQASKPERAKRSRKTVAPRFELPGTESAD